jgi:hypothetical protein
MVRNGKLTSIIFIRDVIVTRDKKQEISGYIDFAHRLKTEDFVPYFTRKKRLLPRPSDLSYYNWETQTYVPSHTHTHHAHARAAHSHCPPLACRLHYCFDMRRSTSNPTPNFQVKADNEQGPHQLPFIIHRKQRNFLATLVRRP